MSDSWRFIPTHVGNTADCYGCPGHVKVHPHACGEYGNARLAVLEKGRFIPTHVGNTQ